jgi:small-conductance mechanosensitive channel
VITAVLAFSMQDTLGNILSGVALQLDNSLRTGDWIRIDDITGRVAQIAGGRRRSGRATATWWSFPTAS